MSVSVVIPTWNEERWLPRLLRTLAAERRIHEVIVADNSSTDQTRSVAAQHGCTVVPGGSPAVGRNLGAAVATGDALLFVDADVVPTRSSLQAAFDPGILDAASVIGFRHLPIASSPFVEACYAVADMHFRLLTLAGVHHSLTSFVLVKRTLFDCIGGYREDISPGEDVDFIRRAGRGGPFHYEWRRPVYISARRFVSENAVVFAAKTVLWEVLRLAESDRSVFGYRWSGHGEELAVREETWLRMKGVIEGSLEE